MNEHKNEEKDEDNRRSEKFEGDRKVLLQRYDSYIQNHTGFLIAIIIGSLVFFPYWEAFFKYARTKILFDMLVALIITSGIYVIKRSCYWSTIGSHLLYLTWKEFSENPKSKKEEFSQLRLIEDLIIERMKKEKKSSTSFLAALPICYILLLWVVISLIMLWVTFYT